MSSRILGLEQHPDEEFFPPTLIPVLYPLQLCPCSCSTGYWTTSWTSSWTSPGTSTSTSWTSLLTLYWRLSQPNLASRFNVNSFVSNRYYFCRHSYAETCLNVSYEEIIFITMSINVICNCHRRDDVMKPSKTLSRWSCWRHCQSCCRWWVVYSSEIISANLFCSAVPLQ